MRLRLQDHPSDRPRKGRPPGRRRREFSHDPGTNPAPISGAIRRVASIRDSDTARARCRTPQHNRATSPDHNRSARQSLAVGEPGLCNRHRNCHAVHHPLRHPSTARSKGRVSSSHSRANHGRQQSAVRPVCSGTIRDRRTPAARRRRSRSQHPATNRSAAADQAAGSARSVGHRHP